MSQNKIKISSTNDEHPTRQPLMAVVDHCLELGAKINPPPLLGVVFPTYRDGYGRCTLVTDIQFKEILDTFTFPEIIQVGTIDNPYLWDKKHNARINFITSQRFQEIEDEQKTRKEKSAELLKKTLKDRGKDFNV